MRGNILLVVNTNVLFSFFGKSTTTRELIFLLSGRLISPEFAVSESGGTQEEVLRKAKIDERAFQRALEILREHVIFVPEDFYSEFIPLALEICPNKDDADFVALSLKVNAPLWSNDRRLKDIKEIEVMNTEEVLKLLGIIR
ncbi:PIN domain-containing protein [Thermococcus sp.]|uniref:PIN domain-containing protein n=1 Tax=Thermococcus sp. TaxID=35749 RepID=UPI002620C921|nr:PIN domain-containing protein [Thermococcus sp.]